MTKQKGRGEPPVKIAVVDDVPRDAQLRVLPSQCNLFTCVWNPVTVALISNEAVVIIFAVYNKIFAPDFGRK